MERSGEPGQASPNPTAEQLPSSKWRVSPKQGTLQIVQPPLQPWNLSMLQPAIHQHCSPPYARDTVRLPSPPEDSLPPCFLVSPAPSSNHASVWSCKAQVTWSWLYYKGNSENQDLVSLVLIMVGGFWLPQEPYSRECITLETVTWGSSDEELKRMTDLGYRHLIPL